MKVSVSSYSFARYMKGTGATYTDICDLAKNIGFEGIEFIDLSTDVQPAEDELTLAKALKEFCADIDLPIVAYTVQADFLKGNPADEVQRLKGCVDIAATLGAPVMRHDGTWLTEGDWKSVIDTMAPYIREVAAYAEAKGVRTCTENHGYFIQDSNRVKYLVEIVGHKNYGWLVDMGNFLCADEDPVHAVTVAAPYAFHVHVKDFLLKDGGWDAPEGDAWMITRGGRYLRGTTAGDGVVPIAKCLQILKNAGYDGFVSLEFEGAENNKEALKNGCKFIKKLL